MHWISVISICIPPPLSRKEEETNRGQQSEIAATVELLSQKIAAEGSDGSDGRQIQFPDLQLSGLGVSRGNHKSGTLSSFR